MAKFVPIYIYAEKVGKSEQEIYRLIRERRFKPEDIKKIKVEKERLRININAKHEV